MNTPLYKDHQAPGNKPQTEAHAGLWFERFFNRYDAHWNILKEEQTKKIKEGKKDWIETVKGQQGNAEKLSRFHSRQQQLISALKGQSQRYSTDWNFVSGMGNPHPVENGFSWHPTLAVPYLAGSAVKGLVRAWVEMNDEELSDSDKKERLKNWFGSSDKAEDPEQCGGYLFFDAIPDEPPTLVCDIMTPHMKDWYQNDKGSTRPDSIPADWHEPTPIPFLAVKQARFVFSIAPRTLQYAEELQQLFEALENALQWLGAGAKTATGYGYMSLDQRFEQEQQNTRQQQQQQADALAARQRLMKENKNRSELAKQYFIAASEEKWAENKAVFMQKTALEDWLDKLEQQEQAEKDIINHLSQLLESFFPGLLTDPEKTKGKKAKPVYSERQRKAAHRINALLNAQEK